jgi:hypothetical protein
MASVDVVVSSMTDAGSARTKPVPTTGKLALATPEAEANTKQRGAEPKAQYASLVALAQTDRVDFTVVDMLCKRVLAPRVERFEARLRARKEPLTVEQWVNLYLENPMHRAGAYVSDVESFVGKVVACARLGKFTWSTMQWDRFFVYVVQHAIRCSFDRKRVPNTAAGRMAQFTQEHADLSALQTMLKVAAREQQFSSEHYATKGVRDLHNGLTTLRAKLRRLHEEPRYTTNLDLMFPDEEAWRAFAQKCGTALFAKGTPVARVVRDQCWRLERVRRLVSEGAEYEPNVDAWVRSQPMERWWLLTLGALAHLRPRDTKRGAMFDVYADPMHVVQLATQYAVQRLWHSVLSTVYMDLKQKNYRTWAATFAACEYVEVAREFTARLTSTGHPGFAPFVAYLLSHTEQMVNPAGKLALLFAQWTPSRRVAHCFWRAFGPRVPEAQWVQFFPAYAAYIRGKWCA